MLRVDSEDNGRSGLDQRFSVLFYKENPMAKRTFPRPGDIKMTTPVRNTAIPKIPAKVEVTHEMIAKRAYEIHLSGQGGSELDNWLRAERELKAL